MPPDVAPAHRNADRRQVGYYLVQAATQDVGCLRPLRSPRVYAMLSGELLQFGQEVGRGTFALRLTFRLLSHLRLMRTQKSSSKEIGHFEENNSQDSSQEQLDSFGPRSDESEMG